MENKQGNINNLYETRIIKRGCIFWYRFPDLGYGQSVQSGLRPVIVVQNELGNKYSPVVLVVPVTSKLNKKAMPTHVELISESVVGLEKNSIALCEQVFSISKKDLGDYIGRLRLSTMREINDALRIEFQLGGTTKENEIKKFALELSQNIKTYEKIIDEYGLFLESNIIRQTEIKMKLEIRRLEQYCEGERLDINEFYNNYKNHRGEKEKVYNYNIDKKVVMM